MMKKTRGRKSRWTVPLKGQSSGVRKHNNMPAFLERTIYCIPIQFTMDLNIIIGENGGELNKKGRGVKGKRDGVKVERKCSERLKVLRRENEMSKGGK